MTTPTGSWSSLAIAAPASTTVKTTLKVGRTRRRVNRANMRRALNPLPIQRPLNFQRSVVSIAGRRDWSWGRTTQHDHPHPRAFRRPIPPTRALKILRFSGGPPPSRALRRFGGPPAFATAPPIGPNTAAGRRQTAPHEQSPRPDVAPRVTAPGQPVDCPRWALPATRSVDCAPSPARRAAPTGPASTPPSPVGTE